MLGFSILQKIMASHGFHWDIYKAKNVTEELLEIRIHVDQSITRVKNVGFRPLVEFESLATT